MGIFKRWYRRFPLVGIAIIFPAGIALAQAATSSDAQVTFNTLLGMGSLLSVLASMVGLITVAVRLTSVINSIKADLEKNISVLEKILIEKISQNKEEISKVNHKFEVSAVALESANELSEKDFVLLQREVQQLLRRLDARVQDLERAMQKKYGHESRTTSINEDIEGL